MKRRRFILSTGVAASGAGLLVGSGAFSRVESQRNVTIEVVGDDDAYLRLIYEDAEVICEEEIVLVTIQNQLKHAFEIVDISLDFDEDHLIIGEPAFPDSLDVGETGEVKVLVACTNADEFTSTLSFDIHVDDPDLGGVLAQSRSIEVTCFCPDETLWAYGGGKTEGVADDETDLPLWDLDGINNWGWYFEFERDQVSREVDLWAAAGQNDLDKGYHVGTATVEDVGDDVIEVTYNLDASLDDKVGFVHLGEAHLYVDEDSNRLSDIKAAPGQLGYENDTGTFEVDLTDVQVKKGSNKDLRDAETLIIAAHGVAYIQVDE